MGLQALRVALDLGRVAKDPVLFRLTGLPAILRELYAAAVFCECRDLDWALAEPEFSVPAAAGFGEVLDLRDFAFDPGFRGVAMIDFFLRRLGVDPDEVAPKLRRNLWLAGAVMPGRPAVTPGYVLVCPRASMALRTMPEEAHRAVIHKLNDLGAVVITQGEGPSDTQAVAAPQARSLAELCDWVAGAALVISTDTAMVHLADAFSVPCLATFTTHRPEWRVRDYPFCRAIYRPPQGLPAALEFSRGSGDEAAARAAWLDADGFRWLTDAVAEAVAATGSGHVRSGRA